MYQGELLLSGDLDKTRKLGGGEAPVEGFGGGGKKFLGIKEGGRTKNVDC